MSGNGYGYGYYPTGSQNYQDPNQQAWNSWALQQQQQQVRSIPTAFPHPPPLHTASTASRAAAQNYYNSSSRLDSRSYQGQGQSRRSGGQYPSATYLGGQSQSPQQTRDWRGASYNNNTNNHINNNKRPRSQDSLGDDKMSKNSKKRKKPLSQNVPSKKDWTIEEAVRALNVEKESNKRFKNHSLIIKFPDLELNRDIVSAFHPSIENVHFQQPSTPRFCFVTLAETADADHVIGQLNKIKFGDGYLTAEYKKDREEDQNIGPEDIDPCTLYVGNLAQEITKEDMVKTYPKGKRIDIGYAKKMKYTRYAFVSFKNVTDSIEAFTRTHSTQMYSKSLIVRFRRLHGTVGMPGETKLQSPAQSATNTPVTTTPATTTDTVGNTDDVSGTTNRSENSNALNNPSGSESNLASSHVPDVGELNTTATSEASDVDLSIVKAERDVWDDEDAPEIVTDTLFEPGSLEDELHRNVVPQVEVKKETGDVSRIKSQDEDVDGLVNGNVAVKTEPTDMSLVKTEEELILNDNDLPSTETTYPDISDSARSCSQCSVESKCSWKIDIVEHKLPFVKDEEEEESPCTSPVFPGPHELYPFPDDESSDDDLGTTLSDVNFGRVYQELEDHSNQIEELRRIIP